MALTTVRPQGMGFNTGRRNLIINGAMQVAQRGTSETSVSTSQYANACDRFKVNGNNGTWTISQDTNAPDGFSNSFKMLLTATETISGTSYWSVEQKMEGQNLQGLAYGTSSAKTVTVSFYVKSNITGTYCLNLYQDDGTKNFPKTYTIDSANTWERKTISFVGDTSTALDNDNAASLRTQFFVVAGSSYNSGSSGSRVAYSDATFAAGHSAQIDAVNDYWQITGLQLEVGENASDFEHRSFGEELAACQRYYWQLSTGVHGNYPSWAATGYNTNQCNINLPFPVPMRTVPTASFNTGNVNYYRFYRGGGNENFGNVATDTITSEHLNMYGDGISHTQGLNGTLQIRLADGAGVFVTAEL
jgi:hypothetical protein